MCKKYIFIKLDYKLGLVELIVFQIKKANHLQLECIFLLYQTAPKGC